MTPPINSVISDLLPCPFCGGTSVRISHVNSRSDIFCETCKTTGPSIWHGGPNADRRTLNRCDAEAIAAWNRRPALEGLAARSGGVVKEVTPRLKTAEQLAVWDIIEQRMESHPSDGITAGGMFSADVQREQRKFLDGMAFARLAAINALSTIEPVTTEGEDKSAEVTINGSTYPSPLPKLGGLQLRALAAIPEQDDLILEGEVDRLISDDDEVVLPARLFSRPQTNWGAASAPNPVPPAEGEFERLQAAYLRGAAWTQDNGFNEGYLRKAAYDYADKTTAALSRTNGAGE